MTLLHLLLATYKCLGFEFKSIMICLFENQILLLKNKNTINLTRNVQFLFVLRRGRPHHFSNCIVQQKSKGVMEILITGLFSVAKYVVV